MQTRSLQTLLSIAQTGSFAKTAAARNMTLSAVSMQIKTLEKELGVMLFDRGFRPPQMTPQGRALCAPVKDLVDAEARMRALCHDATALEGQFRLGFVPTASVRLLPDFLIRAAAAAPQATFLIETDLSAGLEAKVINGALDAAVITRSPHSDPRLAPILLRHEAMAFAVPAHLAHLPHDQLFATLPFLHFMPRSGIGALIANHLGERLENRILLDSVEAIMECVNRGLGFTLLPEPDIDRFATQATKRVTQSGQTLSRDLVLIVATSSLMQAKAPPLAALFDDPAG